MKPFVLLLALALGAFAQNSQPQTGDTVTIKPVVVEVEEHPAPPGPSLTRIDLDFKGGPPAALIEAISKALGNQVNVIVDEADSQVRLPPIRVRSATINDVFSALATATLREIPLPTGRDSYQMHRVQSQFKPTDSGSGITDDTVWSFVSNEPETQQALLKSEKVSKSALRHFQLGSYLSDKLTVEDITTTIRTGWEMLGIREQPVLKFHKETGILIAAGDAELLEQIPMVLQQLPTQNGAPLPSAAPRPSASRPQNALRP
jgi:hypothetical protein